MNTKLLVFLEKKPVCILAEVSSYTEAVRRALPWLDLGLELQAQDEDGKLTPIVDEHGQLAPCAIEALKEGATQ